MAQRSSPQLAILFEAGLAVVALILGWLATRFGDISIWERVFPDPSAVGAAVLRGVLATVPMLVAFFLLYRWSWQPAQALRRQMEVAVRSLLGGASIAQLAIVAALAGIGEELLFRGVLQTVIAEWSTPTVGLVVASLLFGAIHCLSKLYFVLATAIGFYFGWLAWEWNEIVAPAVAHGLYDFVALLYVLKR